MSKLNDTISRRQKKAVLKKLIGYLEGELESIDEMIKDRIGKQPSESKSLVLDIIYGVGCAISPAEYGFADGAARFRQDLLSILEEVEKKRAGLARTF